MLMSQIGNYTLPVSALRETLNAASNESTAEHNARLAKMQNEVAQGVVAQDVVAQDVVAQDVVAQDVVTQDEWHLDDPSTSENEDTDADA